MKSKLQLLVLVSGLMVSLVSASYCQTAPNGYIDAATLGAMDNGAVSPAAGRTTEAGVPALINGDNDLLVYPNPTMSSTHVLLDMMPGSPVYIDIIDLNGQVDRSFQYAPGSYLLRVDMSNLPAGLYSVRVSGSDAGYHNLKVIKE